jgi:hypothetical protein
MLGGADAVAAHTATYSKLYPFVRLALVNGAAGAVVAPHGRVYSVMAFTVTNGKIVQIDASSTRSVSRNSISASRRTQANTVELTRSISTGALHDRPNRQPQAKEPAR